MIKKPDTHGIGVIKEINHKKLLAAEKVNKEKKTMQFCAGKCSIISLFCLLIMSCGFL